MVGSPAQCRSWVLGAYVRSARRCWPPIPTAPEPSGPFCLPWSSSWDSMAPRPFWRESSSGALGGGGWPSLLVLFFALAIAQACIIDQSLFDQSLLNDQYDVHEGWAETHQTTLV